MELITLPIKSFLFFNSNSAFWNGFPPPEILLYFNFPDAVFDDLQIKSKMVVSN